jgi:hypothetical protein
VSLKPPIKSNSILVLLKYTTRKYMKNNLKNRIHKQRKENSLEIELWDVIEKHRNLNFLSIAGVLISMGLHIIVKLNYERG